MSEEGVVAELGESSSSINEQVRGAAPVLLQQAERVRARPRHSLPRRLARAARAALQWHFPLKVGSASSRSLPLSPERAAGLFRSGALETHISRALGNTVGLDAATTSAEKKLFEAVKGRRTLQLSGKHPLGPSTVCETMIQGTKVSLLELQVKTVHSLINPVQSNQAKAKTAGRIALITVSDLQSRHRVTMESTFGSEEDKHCLSTVLSSDMRSRLSWGLASSHNVHEKLVIFSRYNNDAFAGQRVIVQHVLALHDSMAAVSKVNDRNTVSPICARTLGRGTQGGLSWTRFFSQQGVGEESIHLKALCSSNGAYSISVKAQLGEVELS